MADSLYGIPLSSLEGKATKVKGGTYYKQNGYSFYVPDDVSDETSAFVYYPGAGGAGNDAAVLRNLINEKGQNQIIIIADIAKENSATACNRYFNLINNIGSANGATISHVETMGFSAGGPNTYKGLISTIKNFPDSGPQSAVFVDVVGFAVTDEDVATLKQNEATLMFIEPNGKVEGYENTLAKAGVDVILCWLPSGHNSHVTLNKEAFENGIVDFTTGEIEALANSGIYKFVRYDANSGQWVEISMEEVAEKFANGIVETDNPYRYFEKLSNIQPVKSDNQFIETKVNIIRNAIKNSNFLTSTGTDSYSSTTNIPNAETELVQSFFATCASLLNLLEKDTTKIAEIGNSYKDLNAQLQQEASQLNNSVNYYTNNSGTRSNSGSRSSGSSNYYTYTPIGSSTGAAVGSSVSAVSGQITTTPVTITSGDPNIDVSKYHNNIEKGFEITVGNLAYEMSDEDYDLLCAIVAAESDKSYDDALAVITTILNRCEAPNWVRSHGNNPIAQATAPNQFVVYQHGSYKRYLNGNAPETVKIAVKDALAGVRNHKYLSFRSNGTTSYSDNQISASGNRYK